MSLNLSNMVGDDSRFNMDNDSYDEHHILHRECQDSISTVILLGIWPKKLTGSHFDWSSQSARARAKERGNPNHRPSKSRWRAFPALQLVRGNPATPFLFPICRQRMSHDDVFDPDDHSCDADETMIDWCSEPLLF